MKRQEGFAAVHTVLLVAIVMLVTGVGVYVYKVQKNTSKTLEDTQNASSGEVHTNHGEKTANAPKEEDSWLLFEPADKAYSVRVPDGWQGVSLNGNLYVREVSKFTYKQGTQAQIEILTEGGWDGASPFAMYNPGSYYDQIVKEGTKYGEIKTHSGLVVEKFIYTETNEPEGIGYMVGAKVYNYYFGKDGRYMQASHVVNPGEADQHELVERMLKTLAVK